MKILNFNEEKSNIKEKEEFTILVRGRPVKITFSDKESVGLKESIVRILTKEE